MRTSREFRGTRAPSGSGPTQPHREYIRHPATIPIEVKSVAGGARLKPKTENVSQGGLAFRTQRKLAPGAKVSIVIPVTQPPFESEAKVAWCRLADRGYEVGVQFLGASEEFRVRMVEQVCHIRDYLERVMAEEGRRLTPNEAAREWIQKNASTFPDDSR